jgi:hypothetical protein
VTDKIIPGLFLPNHTTFSSGGIHWRPWHTEYQDFNWPAKKCIALGFLDRCQLFLTQLKSGDSRISGLLNTSPDLLGTVSTAKEPVGLIK